MPVTFQILWWDAWNDIIYLMDHNEISGISAFDQKFSGTQSVFNWASNFDMGLEVKEDGEKSITREKNRL